MMKKIVACIVFILIIVALAITACVDGGDKTGSARGSQGQSLNAQQTMAANATATFGAEQFHLQLTAMAEEQRQTTPTPHGP